MKLRAVHLFIILIGALLLSSVLGSVREGMTNETISKNKKTKEHSEYIGPAGDVVDVYGPIENPLQEKKKERIPPPELTYPSYNTESSDTILKGIPKSEIPEGDEDLYILKSQIVPPVCPACPPVVACPNQTEKECPPCRPCGRCPEPSFECKKVPNYDAGMKNEYLPRPILADFSQFGM
jgi:hypothetical protein